MSLVSVITCTGARPEAFQLCCDYMQRQTYKGNLQWIVVDDSGDSKEEVFEKASKYGAATTAMAYVNGPVIWQPGLNTQRFNMFTALKSVVGDKLLIMEDDEWYAPNYIEEMCKLLNFVDVAGEGNAKYYHVGVPGHKEMRNAAHASLCQTGLTRNAYQLLQSAVDSGELYFDIHLWRQVHEKRVSCVVFQDVNLCVGMKGMPGRAGIGVGHKTKDYLVDPNLVKLKEWLGADADNYLPFIKRRKHGRDDHTGKQNEAGKQERVLSEREGLSSAAHGADLSSSFAVSNNEYDSEGHIRPKSGG